MLLLKKQPNRLGLDPNLRSKNILAKQVKYSVSCNAMLELYFSFMGFLLKILSKVFMIK